MAGVREPFSVAILAGGFGTRLGRDKAACTVAGRPLLHWTALAAAACSDDLIAVRRADQALPPAADAVWREAVDGRAGRGPLAGLEAALAAARHDLAVLVACDMPLLRPAALRAVAAAAEGVDVAMPIAGGREQPLLAAYRRGVLARVTGLLDGGEGRLRALLPLAAHRLIDEAALREADPELESLANVNRPEDLERVAPLLAAAGASRGIGTRRAGTPGSEGEGSR